MFPFTIIHLFIKTAFVIYWLSESLCRIDQIYIQLSALLYGIIILQSNNATLCIYLEILNHNMIKRYFILYYSILFYGELIRYGRSRRDVLSCKILHAALNSRRSAVTTPSSQDGRNPIRTYAHVYIRTHTRTRINLPLFPVSTTWNIHRDQRGRCRGDTLYPTVPGTFACICLRRSA